MGLRKVQMSCAGGELSPAMFGRFDDQKYQAGLAKCRNFIVLPQGPAVVRPGTSYVNAAKYSDFPCRLIPFTFSVDETMVLEFGDKYVRFHTNGKTLLKADGSVYEIATPYAAEDVEDIHYAQSMDVMTLVHPKYAPQELRRYGNTDWRMVAVSFGAPLSPPSGPTVVYEVVAGKDVTITDEERNRYTLKYRVTALKRAASGEMQESPASVTGSTQGNLYLNNATCTISWGGVSGAERYRVYKNYKGMFCYIGETDELSFVDDNYEPDASITPPIYDDPFSQIGGIQSVTVTNGGSGYGDGRITDVSPDCTTKLTWQGKPLETGTNSLPINIEGQAVKACVVESSDGGRHATVEPIIKDEVLTGFRITNAGSGYKTAKVHLITEPTGLSVFAFISDFFFDCVVAQIPELEVSDATGRGAVLEPSVFNGAISSVRIANGGSGYSNPLVQIRHKGGSGAVLMASTGSVGDYPAAVCYYEQRRCFAGTTTHPQTVWMTRTGTESDMSYTLPSQDDNRLRFQIAAQEASRIFHLTPVAKLLALTNSTEYCVGASGNGAIAPDSIDTKVQSHVGASNVMPVVVNSTVVYASSRGGHVREIGYNWQSSGYSTGDLSIRAAHFFDTARVKDMALAKSPDSIVWFAMTDGSLLGLTYLPEQSIGAWHKHVTVGGAVESVTTVPEGDEDILYLVVRRAINGRMVRYIERMHERTFGALEDAWCVDCGGEYRGEATTTVSGLHWLEGQTVSILADGCVLPQRVVTDGKVTLTQPFEHVLVGLPIIADLQTLPVAIQLQDGSFGMGHMKNVNDIFIRVYQSSGIFMGPDFDNLVEVKQRTTEPYGSPPEMLSQEVSVMSHCQWNDSGQICIRQKDPLPLTIVSIAWDLAQ